MVEPPGATGPTGDWEKVYATSDVATLPWYSPALDTDIERALKAHRLRSVRILDLGTGPATQAMNLAKRGFDVVATDISASAIKKAKASAKEAGLSITFLVDNVLKSRLAPNLVDVIVDRGVFHVMPKDKRPVYVETVHRVLRPKGWLFLKCFSDKEPGRWGPFRIAEPELIGSFRGPFEIRSVVETVSRGTLSPCRKPCSPPSAEASRRSVEGRGVGGSRTENEAVRSSPDSRRTWGRSGRCRSRARRGCVRSRSSRPRPPPPR